MLSAQNQAQTPQTGPAQGQPDAAQAPLTPLQQRDQEVREYDPLDRDDKDSNAGKATKASVDKAKADRDADKRRSEDQTPTPGSIAASEQRTAQRSGPQVVEDGDDVAAPVQEYSGPAVLSRSYSISQPLIPEQIKWQESIGVNSIYDSGISRSVNADGSPGAPVTLFGTEVGWSLAGRHYFRRDMFSVSYSGNLSRYTSSTGYNGTNQSISVGYSRVLSRRVTLNLGGSGSLLSQNYTLQNQPVGPETIANINLSSSPNIQIYDLGTKQFSGQADLTWQKNSRLSFSAGTSYFAISRDAAALLGMTGQQARGDMDYRLTRKTTIGSYYSFNHYVYPHGAGNSATNTAGAIFSYAINRTMQVRFRGGLSRVSSIGLETVMINPAIAALLGATSGIIDARSSFRTSDFSAQFVKDFRGGRTASLAYAHGISPGDGVFQTSQQESMSANLTARLFRTYSISAGTGRDTLVSVTGNIGKYQSEYGQLTLSRTYRRGIGVSLSAEYRHFDVANLGYLSNQLRISSGITWSPGAGRLWPF